MCWGCTFASGPAVGLHVRCGDASRLGVQQFWGHWEGVLVYCCGCQVITCWCVAHSQELMQSAVIWQAGMLGNAA
jgi:hypothetical protein